MNAMRIWIKFGNKQYKAEEMDSMLFLVYILFLAAIFGIKENEDILFDDRYQMWGVPKGIRKSIYFRYSVDEMQKFDHELMYD